LHYLLPIYVVFLQQPATSLVRSLMTRQRSATAVLVMKKGDHDRACSEKWDVICLPRTVVWVKTIDDGSEIIRLSFYR
jgi:hypothetical protein